MDELQDFSFLQTYRLKQDINKFREKGITDAHKDNQQLHDRVFFEPVRVNKMIKLERKRAMESLILLNENREGTIKARMFDNGSTQRSYIFREETTSLTAVFGSYHHQRSDWCKTENRRNDVRYT